MGLTTLMQEDPLLFVIVLAGLLLSLAFHEWAHAWTADRLGDPTPRQFGRVTLNPIKHLDPFGVLLLVFAGFGFAKPVPINPQRLGRWGTFWATAAGPISNLLIALVMALLIKVTAQVSPHLFVIFVVVMSINVTLAVFNMIPVPPLDGSRILAGLFPALARPFAQFEAQPFSFMIVMMVLIGLKEPIGRFLDTVQGFAFKLVGL